MNQRGHKVVSYRLHLLQAFIGLGVALCFSARAQEPDRRNSPVKFTAIEDNIHVPVQTHTALRAQDSLLSGAGAHQPQRERELLDAARRRAYLKLITQVPRSDTDSILASRNFLTHAQWPIGRMRDSLLLSCATCFDIDNLDSLPSMNVDMASGRRTLLYTNALGMVKSNMVGSHSFLMNQALAQEIYVRGGASLEGIGLRPGKIGFSVPTTMKAGNHYTVSIRVIAGADDTLLLMGVGAEEYVVEDLPISKVAGARLSDYSAGSDFRITPISSERQPIDSILPTVWRWDVVPLRGGRLPLLLTILAYVSLEDNVVRDIPVFERSVVVSSSFLYQAGWFFGAYWQFLLTAIILPLITWLFNRRFKWFGKKKTTPAGFRSPHEHR